MLVPRDRRKDERFDKVFSVYITGAWGSSFGIARNISEGGMFIETLDPYPLASKMEITFAPPNGDTEMTAVGEVVHLCFLNQTAGGGRKKVMVGMGVRFVHFVEEQVHRSAQLETSLMQ